MYSTVSMVATDEWRYQLLADREKTLERIYARTYPMVLHYIKQHSGTEEDAKDILQDAIILFYEKVMDDELTLTASVSTYLVGICKNLWKRELEKRNRQSSFTPETIAHLSEDAAEIESDQSLSLIAYVERLGEKCKEILVSFYYKSHKMDKIAADHGYRNLHTATVQKFKCLERLRKSLSTFSIEQFK
jgi:RNA polymerase sigma factor (sigma-70 family)